MYGSKPENERLFCVSEVGQIAGCSNATVHRIAKMLKIQARIYKSKNSRASYFSYEEMKLIEENYNKHGNDYREMKATTPFSVSYEPEDHPLVKDKRCLNLSWWPETVPVCFQECEE